MLDEGPDSSREETTLGDLSDRSLLRRLRGGSEDAATRLYLKYSRRLQALAEARCGSDLAPRVDAEDIVQSVFRTFFRRVARGEYDVPEGEELWKLLLVMGLNKIRAVGAFHRAARRNVRASAGLQTVGEITDLAAHGDEASLNILRMAIDEVMVRFSPSHREILNLRIEGYDVAAIASRLGRSKRSVERILQELLKALSKLCETD
jgi:RNA polymerase sigma-70 factor, ECF subfamily